MKKFLSIMLAILMVVTMLPMAVMPASAAYDYDETAKISFKITNLVREWKGETEELGEYGSGFYEQSLTKVADGKYKYTYKAALSAGGGTWWSDPKTVTFDGVDCESDYYKTFDFTESTSVGGYTMTWIYTLEVKRYKGHTYSAWSDNGDGTHTRTCVINSAHKETASHNYAAATCSVPETCKNCGATQGEPVADAHGWNASTCVLPQTCKYCGITQGEVLGHNMVAATFGKPAACSRCGATDINISVLEAALINTNVNLPSKAVKDDNAGYNDITWSVVDAGSTGATINGNTLKASYSGEAVIRATIESGSKDFTILFKSSENIDISFGSVIVSKKDASTLTVAYASFEGGSKDYMVGEPIQITGTTTSNYVEVSSGSPSIVLSDVSIDVSGTKYACALSIESGASVDLKLDGSNTLKSGDYVAGIYVVSGASITIGGDGILNVTSAGRGAGIGGNNGGTGNFRAGSITINSGTVNATGGTGGAGIGAGFGWGSGGGTVTINGGTVTATGGSGGAGIGGGANNGNGGTVVITGGSVKAVAGEDAEAIGRGQGSGSSGSLTNGSENGSQSLTCKTILLSGVGDGVSVIDIDVPAYYGTNSVVTRDGGKLFLYLPADTMPTCITLADGTKYICNRNNTFYTEHNWTNATCFNPKHCSECGITDGDALEHNYKNGICLNCGIGEDGHFYISNVNHLMAFAAYVNLGHKNTNATLMADIDLAEYTWTPIGVTAMGEGVTNGYTGSFDGNGHVIRNVTFATPASAMAAGIFGTVQYGGTVRNLGVENLSFDDNTYDHRAGGIAGQLLADSTISDCYVSNSTVKASSRVVGGIVGMNNGTVKNCYTCNMSLAGYNRRFGGISGDFSAGKLENCYTDYSALASSQAGTATNCKAGVSADVFASGEIAYLLNGSTSEGELVWGQLIGTDSYPVFVGETVYYNESKGYYNILHTCDFSGEWKYDADKHWKGCTVDGCSETSEEAEHSYTDGKCDCGYECTHENETGDICSVCGATIKFATITGVSINIDGVIYTSDNTSAENPAVINPDSVVTVTVTGENFDLLPAGPENAMIGFTYFSQNMQWLYNNPFEFDIDTVNNTVSFLANYNVLSKATTASELTYTNDGWYTDIGSGVYVIYIDKKDIADTLITLDNTEFIYSGNPIEPTVLVMADSQTLMEGEHYTLTFESNVNAGTASVTVKGIGDYTGEVTKDFTITKAYYNLTAPTPNTLTYNREKQYLVSAGTVEGADFEYSLDGVSWSTSIPQAKDVGNYTVYYRVLADENHYGIEGTVDVTIKECPHEWDEGVLTRPVYDAVLGSKDGYYTYTCTLCGEEKTETVKSADYSAYEAVSEEINALLQSDELTDAAKQAIYSAANECGLPSNDLTESEQNIVDDLVAELEKIVADAEEKIASGEYVKIDGIKEYNKIADALDAELMENYSQEEFAALAEKAGDEINARLGEIIEKAEALTGSVAENKDALAEIESELSALYAEVKNCLDGVHNGFVYEVTEEAKCDVNAIESATCTLCGETDEREIEGTALKHSFTKYEVTEEAECGKAGKEVAYCDHGCQTTDEREIPALKHIFLDYVSNGDATCEADGTKTASCLNGCGTTDTVADEGSMLDHTDEDGDKLCDDCGEEVYDRCDICGGKAHGDDKIQLVFCMIITIIRFVTSILKSIN